MENPTRSPGVPSREIPNAPNEMRKIRIAKGYTLRGFARELGVSATSLQRHETENKELGEDIILKAAEILQTDPRRLDRKMRLRSEKIDALTAKLVEQSP